MRIPYRFIPRLAFVACAALFAACPAGAAAKPVRVGTASATARLARRNPPDLAVLLRAAQERHDTKRFMARRAKSAIVALAAVPLIPGYGYVVQPGRCSCLRRHGVINGGPLDCWRMDLAADPFPSRPGHQAQASYAGALARYHLHVQSVDYYEDPLNIPSSDVQMGNVKGYLADNCDAENWLGRCAQAMRARCLANEFGTAATHDCEIDPNNGVTVTELTDWIAANAMPGQCPTPFTAWWSPRPPLPFVDGFEDGLTKWRKG